MPITSDTISEVSEGFLSDHPFGSNALLKKWVEHGDRLTRRDNRRHVPALLVQYFTVAAEPLTTQCSPKKSAIYVISPPTSITHRSVYETQSEGPAPHLVS